jgi:alkanesulfonate monooxygenase SsuD/methylene tetrahydromethanopterin reductase-like flavin-dependent oxidoreductase (luciferase family)
MSNDAARTGVEECWTSLAALGALVPRLRLGSLVAGNTYRHPAIVANMAATIDRISGGRLVLGLGAGWQQNEHDAYGLEFPAVGPRLKRFAEACAVLHAMLRQSRTTFSGEYYQLVDAPLDPRPIQQPIPLLIGGAGERVMLGIVARYADEWNCWGTPAMVRHKISVLAEHCAAIGRDPAEIRKSAQALLFMDGDPAMSGERPVLSGPPPVLAERVAEYVDAGVDELIVPDFTLGTLANRLGIYDRFFEEVAAGFR